MAFARLVVPGPKRITTFHQSLDQSIVQLTPIRLDAWMLGIRTYFCFFAGGSVRPDCNKELAPPG